MKLKSAVIISYVPLLRGSAGDLIDLSVKSAEGQLRALYDKYIDSDAGRARGCMWSKSDDKIGIVFVLENAAALHEHLIGWAEGVPQRWFDLCLYDNGVQYVVALMPKFELSVERFKEANKVINNIDVDPNAKFNIVAKPILFTSDPNPATFFKIKDTIPDRIDVAFTSPDKVHPGITESDILDLGSFKLNRDKYHEYLADALKP